jgi:hypothetical protein
MQLWDINAQRELANLRCLTQPAIDVGVQRSDVMAVPHSGCSRAAAAQPLAATASCWA